MADAPSRWPSRFFGQNRLFYVALALCAATLAGVVYVLGRAAVTVGPRVTGFGGFWVLVGCAAALVGVAVITVFGLRANRRPMIVCWREGLEIAVWPMPTVRLPWDHIAYADDVALWHERYLVVYARPGVGEGLHPGRLLRTGYRLLKRLGWPGDFWVPGVRLRQHPVEILDAVRHFAVDAADRSALPSWA